MVIMRQFGRCFRVDLARNGLGQSKGFAFVEFEKQEDAKIAVEQLDTATLENNHLRCEISEFPPDELITMYVYFLTSAIRKPQNRDHSLLKRKRNQSQ